MTEKTNQSVELRDYQVDMLERLEKAWKQNRSVMVQMPTGTGKTWLMAVAIRREKGRVNSEKFATAPNSCRGASEGADRADIEDTGQLRHRAWTDCQRQGD